MAGSPLIYLVAVVAGMGTGVLGAMLGTGGGVFLVPVLVIGLGVPMHQAVATSIISVIATSSAVASTNVERGTANMRLGMTLEIATALGAIASSVTAAKISAPALETIFALILPFVAILMWPGRVKTLQQAAATDQSEIDAESLGALGSSYIDNPGRPPVAYRVRRLWAGLGISFLAGNLSGLLGVGGGIFKVPALHLACGVPIKAAAATSNFMIGVTAAASAFLYFGRGDMRPALTAGVALGVVAGSAIGTVFNRRVHSSTVRKMFAILLLAVAAQMIYRALIGRA